MKKAVVIIYCAVLLLALALAAHAALEPDVGRDMTFSDRVIEAESI